MAGEKTTIGRVASIYRYPVKSMRGERLESAEVGWRGLAGDRRFAFIDLANRSGFPWLTARQFHGMVRYEPRFEQPADPGKSRILVRTPAGRDLAVDSPELLAELARESGRAIQLLQNQSGVFDTFDFSIIARQSIEALSSAIGSVSGGGGTRKVPHALDSSEPRGAGLWPVGSGQRPKPRGIEDNQGLEERCANGTGKLLDERRFRPNIVLDCAGDEPFCEDRWVGGLVRFGERGDSAAIRVNRADLRCMVINIDPDDASTDPAIHKHVAQTRGNRFGVYGSVQVPGTIRVGEDVFLEAG